MVKEPLLLPVFLLFSFLCALVLFAALDMFGAWGSGAGGAPFTLATAIAAFPASAQRSLVPAVLVALVLSGLRMARKSFSRLLGIVICLAAGYILLVNGMILLGRLDRQSGEVRAAAPYFPARSFVRVGGALLSADTVTGDALGGVLAFDGGRAAERLSVYPAGRLSAGGGTLTVRLAGAAARTLTRPLEPPLGNLFRPDRFTELALRDIAVVTADLRDLASRALAEFFVSCFSVLFLWVAMLSVLRFTRWPLLNLLLLGIAIRGSLSLYHLLSVTLRSQITSAVSDPTVARLAPSAVLALIGLAFLLIDILFVPADRWRQGAAL
jgi:hypothetical protein